jgi:hypothetical protein
VTNRPTAAAAAWNNASWCDAVCRARGGNTQLVDGLWISQSEPPPYYPNVVTYGVEGVAKHLRHIGALVEEGVAPGWGIKDSFQALDLAPLGLDVLFEAEWLGLPANEVLITTAPSGATWEQVETGDGLAAWEMAWSRANEDAAAPGSVPIRVFAPGLIKNPDVVLIAAHRHGEIIATVAGNPSDDGSGAVAGVSNITLLDADRQGLRAEAIDAVRSAFHAFP